MAEENRYRRIQEHRRQRRLSGLPHGSRLDHPNHPIGVFDSGVGGLSVLRALRTQLPHEHFVYFADSAHAPYGERGDAYVTERALAVAAELTALHQIKALVVACNTATAAAIDALRAAWPEMPVVGVEPALKPAAALTRTGVVGVMATRGTLASCRFAALHASLTRQAHYILQPCDGLAEAIERQNTALAATLCRDYTRSIGPFGTENSQVDTLVLGCTHYPFVEDTLRGLVGPAVRLLDTGAPVAQQLARRLSATALTRLSPDPGGLHFMASGDLPELQAATARWQVI